MSGLFRLLTTWPAPQRVSSFDGTQLLPPPPSLPAGTYHLGTLVWDTSAATAGVHDVDSFQVAGLDGTGIVLAGSNIVDVTGSETLGYGAVTITAGVPALSALAAAVLVVCMVLLARHRL